MAEDKPEGGGKKSHKKDRSKENRPIENGEDDEPDFSDPEDFIEDVTDEGKYTLSDPFTGPYCACSRRSTCQMEMFPSWQLSKRD